ncbi:acyl-CoA dehydrogenase [Halogeometricum pallidum JCM 14848]|uniref:Acyl-CoA dehydrogenase n=1 Tax=Halogeometricum pallidum JCM 14848 TaxID=1227487 RepID=M0D2M4_HALPD|nr:acyl-CoA dehydrogenase family protein [Halogeometricum pallidum]ELZ28404.1 acyl-CoA dehydrogenase [Halogeometricum pallidum JCM 14848]
MRALTAEQREFAERAESVAAEFTDDAYTWHGDVPWENLEELAEADLYCPSISEEYGGQGLSDLTAMLLTEAVGRECPDTGWFTYMQSMVAPRAIDLFGSDSVKEEFLPAVTAGESFVSIAISEPEAGSDVGSMTTEVTEEDGRLVCNGEKTWVGGVPFGDAAVTWVRFPEGLGSVVIPYDDPGVEIQEVYTNMAGYSQTHFTIDDVVVPERRVLTRGQEAFKEQLVSLNWERLGSSILTVAWAEAALERALSYASEREQFGRTIDEFQGIEWKLAEMYRQVETAASLAYASAAGAEGHERAPPRLQTSTAKLHCSRVAEEVVSEAVQIVGARAYQQGHPLEYLYRFARSRRIAAGTDEMQLNTIARALEERGLPAVSER